MESALLLKAFEYKAWADLRTLEAILRLDASHAESLHFATRQLNHMVIVEEMFRSRLLEAASFHDSTNTHVLPSLAELQQRISSSDAWYRKYASQLQSHQMSEVLDFTFSDGRPGSMSRQEMLFHIINHGTYHRGAIGHALDLGSVPHPADTYTVFIHAVEPERRKPTRPFIQADAAPRRGLIRHST